MGLKVEQQESSQVVVVPKGKIDVCNSQEFKEELLAVSDQGYSEIVIDFKNVERIDSSGLGKLLAIYKKLRGSNGELRIINVKNDYIKKMFKMINLDQLIKIEGLEK
ncbi:STAS domain-containing protein [Natroniella sulfidigena]|uniref:STAS domain-containing protein n=1 Tax=Natroniella sulfidigena TaxID=723921 RepID=UPI00200AC0E8|nr:STAS domain-containing protein [Natroniella sulfidigena]MCK8816818.1 STAS domain-containing protein [Natroniella sulfidigena]